MIEINEKLGINAIREINKVEEGQHDCVRKAHFAKSERSMVASYMYVLCRPKGYI
jgi:hypothetical protein